MSKPLDELYLRWLYSQVGDPATKNPARTYWRMLKQLYTKEFVWIIPNDDNRIEDGKGLRYEFVDQEGLTDVDPGWLGLGSSFLELLIGLSRRLSFMAEETPKFWFWHLVDNLGICYTDKVTLKADVDMILDQVIWRTYGPDGVGGLFPLRRAQEDQTKIEIWYQMCAYVLEQG